VCDNGNPNQHRQVKQNWLQVMEQIWFSDIWTRWVLVFLFGKKCWLSNITNRGLHGKLLHLPSYFIVSCCSISFIYITIEQNIILSILSFEFVIYPKLYYSTIFNILSNIFVHVFLWINLYICRFKKLVYRYSSWLFLCTCTYKFGKLSPFLFHKYNSSTLTVLLIICFTFLYV